MIHSPYIKVKSFRYHSKCKENFFESLKTLIMLTNFFSFPETKKKKIIFYFYKMLIYIKNEKINK